MFYEYGIEKDGKVLIKLKEKSFSKDLFEIFYDGKMVGSLKKGASEFKLPDGKVLTFSRKFMADKYDLKIDTKELIRFSSWRLSDEQGKKMGYLDNTGIEKQSHKTIFIVVSLVIIASILYGVFLLPNRDYPYPLSIIENILLISLIAIYIFRKKINSKLVTVAKYLFWIMVFADLGYTHYLALTGALDLSRVIWGDLFLFVIPGVLFWVMKVTILKNTKLDTPNQ